MGWRFHPGYFACFVVILAIEVGIALFVHDHFVRPFLGDVLVIVLLYSLAASALEASPARLAAAVLAFGFAVETIQYFDPIGRFHLEHHRVLAVVVGRTFALEDFAAYLSGFLVVLGVEYTLGRGATR
ncbi:MAG: DUF2809 domain-containing protein [Vulcanimicrobiota bacterium]